MLGIDDATVHCRQLDWQPCLPSQYAFMSVLVTFSSMLSVSGDCARLIVMLAAFPRTRCLFARIMAMITALVEWGRIC